MTATTLERPQGASLNDVLDPYTAGLGFMLATRRQSAQRARMAARVAQARAWEGLRDER